MRIHILGICGTFMGGIEVLAKQAGNRVTGCDANVYQPMSFVGWSLVTHALQWLSLYHPRG